MKYVVLVLLSLWADVVFAKALYVNNSGSPACSNATTYANNDASNPWCLIGRATWGSTNPNAPSAAQAAAAGDVVLITAGTYTTDGLSGGGRWDVALNPANSGTSGNPITFRGVGTVNVRMTSGHTGPTIGADGRDYIVWDNIQIDDQYNGTVSDTAPVVFHSTTGSQLLNSTIVGTFRSWADNYSGIRTEVTYNVLIKNVTISNITGNGGTNNAGIMLYDSQDLIIEHCDISAANTGIYLKGDSDTAPAQSGAIIRLNRIHDNVGRGIELGAAQSAKVYQNIIKGNLYGSSVQNFNPPQSSNISVVNNVFVSTNIAFDAGLTFPGTSAIVAFRAYNNIFYGSFSQAINIGTFPPGDVSYEHNIYNGYDAWGSYSGFVATFATWQGTGQDSAVPASVTTDPSFVNTTDYKLSGGSPGVNLGVDILDLNGNASTSDAVNAGAYISGNEVIGVEVTSSSVSSTVSSGGIRFTGEVRIQ